MENSIYCNSPSKHYHRFCRDSKCECLCHKAKGRHCFICDIRFINAYRQTFKAQIVCNNCRLRRGRVRVLA